MLSVLLSTCLVIISPGTNGDVREKYLHELAHCNGWEHPDQAAPSDGKAYSAYKPPHKYLRRYRGRMKVRLVSTSRAQELCNGHYACMKGN